MLTFCLEMFSIQRLTNDVAPPRAQKAKKPVLSNMMLTRDLRYAQKTKPVGTAIVKENQNGSRS